MTNFLELHNVVKEFPIRDGLKRSAFRAVDDVSFTIPKGTTFGLVGESGSGKSTVARIVTRLLTATSGRVTLDGADVNALAGSDLLAYRRRAQIVFQDPFSSLNPRMTVEELLTEPFEIHKLHSKAERSRLAAELVSHVGLTRGSLAKKPVEFSGGQRQRILIARAIALKPALIVADEPVSALDVLIQAQILNLLKDLQQELGLTYLFISHDLSVVNFMSDHIGVMRQGKLVEQGTCEQIYRSPKEQYTKDLIAAVPSESVREEGR